MSSTVSFLIGGFPLVNMGCSLGIEKFASPPLCNEEVSKRVKEFNTEQNPATIVLTVLGETVLRGPEQIQSTDILISEQGEVKKRLGDEDVLPIIVTEFRDNMVQSTSDQILIEKAQSLYSVCFEEYDKLNRMRDVDKPNELNTIYQTGQASITAARSDQKVEVQTKLKQDLRECVDKHTAVIAEQRQKVINVCKRALIEFTQLWSEKISKVQRPHRRTAQELIHVARVFYSAKGMSVVEIDQLEHDVVKISREMDELLTSGKQAFQQLSKWKPWTNIEIAAAGVANTLLCAVKSGVFVSIRDDEGTVDITGVSPGTPGGMDPADPSTMVNYMRRFIALKHGVEMTKHKPFVQPTQAAASTAMDEKQNPAPVEQNPAPVEQNPAPVEQIEIDPEEMIVRFHRSKILYYLLARKIDDMVNSNHELRGMWRYATVGDRIGIFNSGTLKIRGISIPRDFWVVGQVFAMGDDINPSVIDSTGAAILNQIDPDTKTFVESDLAVDIKKSTIYSFNLEELLEGHPEREKRIRQYKRRMSHLPLTPYVVTPI